MTDSVGSVSVDVVPDARGWAASLRRQIGKESVRVPVKPEVDPATEETFREKGKTSGSKFAGEFDRTIQTRIRAALDAIPDLKIGADTSAADLRLAGLRTELDALSSVRVGVDVSSDEALAKIEGVRAALAALGAESPNVQVNVDSLAAAAQLAEVQAQVDTLNGKTAKVKVDVERSTLSRAISGIDSFGGKLGLLPSLAIAAGAALIPLTGVLGGIVATLGAPLAIAGGGATLYAFLAGAAIKQTESQKKKIDQLKTAVDSARQSLANTQASAASSAQNSLSSAQSSAALSLAAARKSAEATLQTARQAEASATTVAARDAARRRVAAAQTALAARQGSINASLSARQSAIAASQSASVEAAQRKVNQATAAYHNALKGLTPDQRKFLAAQAELKSSFHDLIAEAGPDLLGPAAKFLGLITTTLPAARPILHAVAGDLDAMFGSLDKGSKSQGFQRFVSQFAHQLGPDLLSLSHIAGNLAGGLGNLFLVIDRRAGSGGMLSSLDHLTANFADWTHTKDARRDVKGFLDYFHANGPQVAHTIGAVAGGIGHIVKALAPLGSPVLRIIEGISNAISAIPVPVLTALAATFVGMVAVQKVGGFKLASKLTSGLGGGSASGGGLLQSIFGTKPVPVFVTNPGFGKGGIPGEGGKGGFLSNISTALLGVTTAAALNSAGNSILKKEYGPTLGRAAGSVVRSFAGGLPDPELVGLGPALFRGIFPNNGGPVSAKPPSAHLTATSTQLDALRANLATTSRSIDLVGPRADAAFGAAAHDVDRLSAKIHDLVTMKYGFSVDANTLRATKQLEALQAFRFHDKAFNAQVYLQLERAIGPGGGMGRPTGPSGGSSGGAGRGGPTYTGPINIHANDYRDMQRQIEARHHRAALDGVNGP